MKEVPPKRIATTNLSPSTAVKRSPTNEQIASITHKQTNTTDYTFPLERSLSERFD